MSEIQLIGDYFSIRQVQSLNSLQQMLQQSERLPNHDVVGKILKHMEQVCRKLTEDILLLIPLESSSTWNDFEKLSQIVNELRKNLTKEDIELAQDSDRVLRSVDCQPKTMVTKENETEPMVNSNIQSLPPMTNNKITAQIDDKPKKALNGQLSTGKPTQTRTRKCGEIQNILVAQTRIASQHQQTKQNSYENWPLSYNIEHITPEIKSNSRSASQSNIQSESASNNKSPGFLHRNIRFFTRKPKVESTFYMDQNEYRK